MKEKVLFWTPRILTMLMILFMLMFSFDVFEGGETIGRKLLGFLIHNIPVIILSLLLVLAWFRELIGGILFIVAAIAACFIFNSFTTNKGSLVIFLPFVFVGIMFIVSHQINRLKARNQT